MGDRSIADSESLPVLLVAGTELRLPFRPGETVRELLDGTASRVASACGGAGTCGLCRVRLVEGAVNRATPSELSRLSPHQLRDGIRLACQLRPTSDVVIEVENPAPQSQWRSIAGVTEELATLVRFPEPQPAEQGPPWGVAVDLGTTHIRVALWDLTHRRLVATRTGLNPQARFGADVLNRLSYALESEAHAQEMAVAARCAIGEALADILDRELAGGGACGERRMVVVGNTAMLSLLARRNYPLLLEPDYWEREIECQPTETKGWGVAEGDRIDLIQPLAGFVGSDLLAGVIALEVAEGPAGTLFIDFGTNTELALWDGNTLWVTSTPGGPAFEGSGISCGMPAYTGAISGVRVEGGEVALQIIGGGAAKGICGSGLVDMAAALLATGMINSGGRFKGLLRDTGYTVRQPGGDLTIIPSDIDAIQRAKAGTGAAAAALLSMAGMGWDALKRVCIAGAFGRHLNVASAQAIGLIPPVQPERVELYGDTALAGASRLLFARDHIALRRALVERTHLMNLSLVPMFEQLFVDNLRLQPMVGKRGDQ